MFQLFVKLRDEIQIRPNVNRTCVVGEHAKSHHECTCRIPLVQVEI